MPPETLEYVETGATEHRHTLVWLHGLGADGHDLRPFADALELPSMEGVRQVFPHAPFRRIDLLGDIPLRAWYRFDKMTFGQGENDADIRTSVDQVEALLKRERRALPADGRLILGGFSQGGLIALAAGLAGDTPVDGIVALSTYLWTATVAARPATPVFMAHGRADPVIPIDIGRTSAERLRAQGIALEWREYAMEHTICAAEILDISKSLHTMLTA
ncbi:hypothetical protein BI364_00145 [Acidihalobacter yilgarnensis]|uniref:Phospholipase/carboxylesterase/thioesterase domain-containing protein n=1 Tax=Acidihalobacter yilgarnensis TaxID=2819280 RepID=A0A1D8IJT0_9GAMM|nr:alpha/beta fold hydrolase [Acidihalobacter yilgarnensis]AOU96641.1 hypothetical protein BI364_00145 [Acidihalobacter yilgarnensis]